VSDENLLGVLEHILADTCAALAELRRIGVLVDKHDRLLEDFAPLLDQFRTPAAGLLAARRVRKTQAAGGAR